MNISQELRRIAKIIDNPLNGMNRQKALRLVNKILSNDTKGLFRDDSWKPINLFFKHLSQQNIEYVIQETNYTQDENGNMNSKVWKVEISFINDKGKETTLFGRIVAGGAGSVKEPLEKYDIVGYFS